MPVVCQGRCPAAVKLVRPPDESEQKFEHLVRVLDVLVRDFAIEEADFLSRLPKAEPPEETLPDPGSTLGEPVEVRPYHALIQRAMQYIEENLPDPTLTVGRVARALGANPNYVSHLFVEKVGQRLGHYISERRIESAKMLLASNDWQIKRVAYETGHANPDWFAHVFRVSTGVLPGEYRARSCRSILLSAGSR